MKYYYIEPEVSGDFGDSTILDTAVHPPKVTMLEYNFKGWMGDHILECFPCFIVSDSLLKLLIDNSISGFTTSSVKISKSKDFEELEVHIELPKFHRLEISGSEGVDDCFIAKDYRLVVSDAFKNILLDNDNKFLDIETYN